MSATTIRINLTRVDDDQLNLARIDDDNGACAKRKGALPEFGAAALLKMLRILDHDDGKATPSPGLRPSLQLGKPHQQAGDVVGHHCMFRHLLAAARLHEVISHFERLSSKEMKIAPRSMRIAVGASGRSFAASMFGLSRVRR
jgi:hypothetical protein